MAGRPPFTLKPLADETIDGLVQMAMSRQRGAPPQDAIRELVRLVEAELQGQVTNWQRRLSHLRNSAAA